MGPDAVAVQDPVAPANTGAGARAAQPAALPATTAEAPAPPALASYGVRAASSATPAEHQAQKTAHTQYGVPPAGQNARRMSSAAVPANDANHSAGKAALLNLPRLYIVDYDMTSGWAQDVFSLPHNAVRRELIDLYTILGAVYKRNARTSREEDEKFSHWWSVFSSFIEEYFDIESRILLPLIGPAEEDPVHKQDIAVLMYQMEDARLKLVKKLREVNEVVEKLFVLPMKDVFPMLCRSLDLFVPILLEYFIEQEEILPNYILGFHSLVMKDVVIQKMADFVLVGRDPQLFIVMISAWMDDKEQLNNWKKKALRGVNRFVNFQRWEAKFVRYHKRIVEDFHSTVLSNPRLRTSRLRSSSLRSSNLRSGGYRNGLFSSRGLSSSRAASSSRGLGSLRSKSRI